MVNILLVTRNGKNTLKSHLFYALVQHSIRNPTLVKHTANDSVQWLEKQYANEVVNYDLVTVLAKIYADCISREYNQQDQKKN